MPGDTIKVCPGEYRETVLVTKTLTFRGFTKAGNGPCDKPVNPDRTKDTILHYPFSGTSGDNAGSPGFIVHANDVVIGASSSRWSESEARCSTAMGTWSSPAARPLQAWEAVGLKPPRTTWRAGPRRVPLFLTCEFAFQAVG
jgi:hypothetical protein